MSQCMARMVAYCLDQECLILDEEKEMNMHDWVLTYVLALKHGKISQTIISRQSMHDQEQSSRLS